MYQKGPKWPKFGKNQKSASYKLFPLVLTWWKKHISRPKNEKEVTKSEFSRYIVETFHPYFARKRRLGPIFKTPYLQNGKRYLSSVKRFWSPISSRWKYIESRKIHFFGWTPPSLYPFKPSDVIIFTGWKKKFRSRISIRIFFQVSIHKKLVIFHESSWDGLTLFFDDLQILITKRLPNFWTLSLVTHNGVYHYALRSASVINVWNISLLYIIKPDH